MQRLFADQFVVYAKNIHIVSSLLRIKLKYSGDIRESENIGNSIVERWNQVESRSENILENSRMLEFSRISRFLRISEDS